MLFPNLADFRTGLERASTHAFRRPAKATDRAASAPLIAHDYFAIRGGGERLVLTLAEAIGADVMFGYRTEESYDDNAFPDHCTDLALPSALRRPGIRAASLAIRFRMAKRQAQAYGTRIYSGVAAPFAAPERGAGSNILYCHTPPRFLYDQKDHFAERAGRDPARRMALQQFRDGYEAAVERMDVIIANSPTVQERISTYLGKTSTVVYPPCDLDAFRWIEQGDYYLSTARLSPLKRVDKIVSAFLRMPERKLIVASSGEDLAQLMALANGAPNIAFLGWVSDSQLSDLIGRAIATIYVPSDEDFGMSPVESMAAGKPVIGVAEGGLRETIVDSVTGILLQPGFTSDDLADAVCTLTPECALEMRAALPAEEFNTLLGSAVSLAHYEVNGLDLLASFNPADTFQLGGLGDNAGLINLLLDAPEAVPEPPVQHGTYGEAARELLASFLEQAGDLQIVASATELVLIDLTAFDDTMDRAYAYSWSMEDGGTIRRWANSISLPVTPLSSGRCGHSTDHRRIHACSSLLQDLPAGQFHRR